MALKVLYDHQIFSFQKIGGISRYFCEIMKHLPRDITYDNSGVYSNNLYIQADFKGLYREFFQSREFKGKRSLISFPNKIDSVTKCIKEDYDVFHPTYYDPYFLKINKKPFVLTVHDMAHEKFPDFLKNDPARQYKKQLIYKADHIVAISEYTKKDLLHFYNKLNPDNISVIYHGNSLSSNEKNVIPKLDRYLLFTGGRAEYKNFVSLINAISSLLIKYNIILICTGSPFTIRELEHFRAKAISDRVFHRYVSDEELYTLYSNAIAFIFPSFYEGFGLPILEAFAASCPVVMSSATCFPEIGGDAALYFDALSIDEMTKSVEKIITDLSLRKVLIEKGRERLKLFNWSKSAILTAEVYNGLV
jgi:glycosyltransferase involved in cell wall biosynthesis